MSSRQGDEALAKLNHLSFQSGKLNVDEILDSFKLDAPILARASLLLQLSQTKEDVALLFSPKLHRMLASNDDTLPKYFAAIRFMTSLFSIAPDAAHKIVFDEGNIIRILSLSANTLDDDHLLAFITSELLCTAANHPSSRRWIVSHSQRKEVESNKIVEIDEASGEDLTTMHWLLSFIEKANLENAGKGSLLSKVALLSSLALHKIQKGSKGKESNETSDVSAQLDEKADAEEKEKRKEEDDLLFELSKNHLLHDEGKQSTVLTSAQKNWQMENGVKQELERVCRLASVESLTYLTIEPTFREAIVKSKELRSKLCQIGISSCSVSDEQTKSLFPQRGSEEGSTTSKYELDKQLSSPRPSERIGQDTALQYGLATLLANVMAYPAILSAEEKQMEKLRKMANAKAKVREGTEERQSTDPLMEREAIERRVAEVINAGGVKMLVSIALGTAKEGRINASDAVRETVAKGLLSMTTRQDKVQRGKIVQQGGARALLTLSNQWIADALRGKEAQARPSFSSMQALAHLLITENPTLVVRDTAECIPSLVYLYLHSASSRLQRFEAALALTNIASLGEMMTRGIVSCSFPRKSVELTGVNDFAGIGAEEQSQAKVKIDGVLQERIFLEENEMSRRSSLELLCNLLMDDAIFKQWSGEMEDEEESTSTKEQVIDLKEGKVMKNLVFLIALCSPLGIDEHSGEGGLKLRLAASGAVATLCSSPSTCARVLAMESRVLNKLSRLVQPVSSVSQGENEEEEKEEKSLHEQDIAEDFLGSQHASLQLALRGLTCLDCLIQYVIWLQGQSSRDVTIYKHKLVKAGCIEAIKTLALALAKTVKITLPNPIIQALQEQVAQQSFNALRACKTLGLV